MGACLTVVTGLPATTVRAAPEFRRLVDGAKASLLLIPKAIATRDADLLHRVLIELRSFDNLVGVPIRLIGGLARPNRVDTAFFM